MDDLYTACKEGDLKTVQRMLDLSHDSHKLEMGLTRAIEANQIGVVKLIMDRGAKITFTVFSSAVMAESIEVWSCMFEHGWDINSVEYGDTILSRSTTNISLVKWLLERGADVNKVGPWRYGQPGTLPLEAAIADNALQTIRILIDNGAAVDNVLIELCLGMSANGIEDECLQILVESGLDPNFVVDRWQCTPLQQAVFRNLLEKARILVKAGANLNVKDKFGITPLDQARENGNQAMIELLESAVSTN